MHRANIVLTHQWKLLHPKWWKGSAATLGKVGTELCGGVTTHPRLGDIRSSVLIFSPIVDTHA